MRDVSLLSTLSLVLTEKGWPLTPEVAALATRLPPVATAGLELPLSVQGPFDLQQRIRPGDEAALLRAWMNRRSIDVDSPWAQLNAFLSAGTFEAEAEELWLELDATSQAALDGTAESPLSIFLRLREPGPIRAETVRALAADFNLILTTAAEHALDRCLAALPTGARLSHLGLMLGRTGNPLRLIVDALPPDGVGTFLCAIGLQDVAASCQQQADALSALTDRFRLALTVGDRVEPRVGFECFIGGNSGDDPRWCAVLDRWVDKGECLPEWRERLTTWPGPLLPFSVAGGWPGPLVAQALARGKNRLRWLECRISHVKVDNTGSVKAYVGFLEQERTTEPATAAPRRSTVSPTERPLKEMHQAAREFLMARRTHTGWWLDYSGFREGISDEWVTGYVAGVMLSAGEIGAATRAWTILSGRLATSRPGWGWNLLQPADADSTIWCLRLAEGLGRDADVQTQVALKFLLRHVDGSGAVSTYLPDDHGAVPINPNWSRPHDCVTAAAAGLGGVADRVVPALLSAQQETGCWNGYWWADPAYPTALAATALDGLRGPRDIRARQHAANWARHRLREGTVSDAFVLSLLLRTARPGRANDPALLTSTVSELARLQRGDGSWEGTARMLIPNAKGERVPAADHAGIFTTATVLATLCDLIGTGETP